MRDSKLNGSKHYLNMLVFFFANIDLACSCPPKIFIIYSTLGGFISFLHNTNEHYGQETLTRFEYSQSSLLDKPQYLFLLR